MQRRSPCRQLRADLVFGVATSANVSTDGRDLRSAAAHNAAVRALAFKWIRILWRCWVDRVPYDESRYLSALQKCGSPVIQFAAQNPS